ncbi:MAG: hypothetical protein AAGF12_09480 [Myxococcota bacterium]
MSPEIATMHTMHGAPELPAGDPLLAPAGPAVILGGSDPFVGPGEPRAEGLYGPRGACLFDDGALFIADTGHHRVVAHLETPKTDGRAADVVLGQPDFASEGRNALGDASALTMNVPTGIAPFGERGMAVADAWNNRVLLWKERPTASHVPPDIVLGQSDFSGMDPNRGTQRATAATMHWPFSVLTVGERLYVADTGNRRVLVWTTLPTESGQPADGVIGQEDFEVRSDNGGGVHRSSMRWPHDLAIVETDTQHLVVSDAGNNRVLIFSGLPVADEPAATVLGQANFEGVAHNRGLYWPNAGAMNMPYAVAAKGGRILVADTASSRLLGFRAPFENGMDAVELTGQEHFGRKGDNRWGLPVRDSLCWPYGIKLTGHTAVLSDTGNHRVLLWDLALIG